MVASKPETPLKLSLPWRNTVTVAVLPDADAVMSETLTVGGELSKVSPQLSGMPSWSSSGPVHWGGLGWGWVGWCWVGWGWVGWGWVGWGCVCWGAVEPAVEAGPGVGSSVVVVVGAGSSGRRGRVPGGWGGAGRPPGAVTTGPGAA